MSQEIFSKKEFEEGALCACSAGLFREYMQKPYFVLVDFIRKRRIFGAQNIRDQPFSLAGWTSQGVRWAFIPHRSLPSAMMGREGLF